MRGTTCLTSMKGRYATRKRALGAMNTVGRRGHNQPEHLSIYKCSDCRSWHLTSQRRPTHNNDRDDKERSR